MTDTYAEVMLGIRPAFRIGKQQYILLDVSTRYSGGTTFEVLGKDLVLSPEIVLESIISPQAALAAQNSVALVELYLDEARIDHPTFGPRGVSPRSIEPRFRPKVTPSDMRAEVQMSMWGGSQGSKFVEIDRRTHAKLKPNYYEWPVPLTTIAVPYSAGFLRRRVKPAIRLLSIAPNLAAFEQRIDELAALVDRLRKAMVEIREVGESNMQELSALLGMSTLSDVLLEQLGRPGPTEHPVAAFKAFLDESALPLAVDRLVRNPKDFAPRAVRLRDTLPDEILDILMMPDFLAGLEVLVTNHDIVDHKLWNWAYYWLAETARVVCHTPAVERWVEEQVLPALRAMENYDLPHADAAIEKCTDPEIKAMFGRDWVQAFPKKRSAIAIALASTSFANATITNSTGPLSLGVAVFTLSAHVVMNKVSGQWLQGGAAVSAALYRFFGRWTSPTPGDWTKIMHALAEGRHDPKLLAKYTHRHIQLENLPMQSALGRSLTGIVAIIFLGVTLLEDPIVDADHAYATFAAFGQAGVAISEMPPLAEALRRGLYDEFARRGFASPGAATEKALMVGRRSTATVVALIGIYLGARTYLKGETRHDDRQMIEGVLAGTGSTFSFLGWMCLEAGVFVISAQVLCVVGAALLVAAVGVAVWRTLASSGPEAFIQGTIDALDPAGSDGQSSRMQLADLQPTLDALRAAADDASFPKLSASYRTELLARGFPEDLVAMIMGDE